MAFSWPIDVCFVKMQRIVLNMFYSIAPSPRMSRRRLLACFSFILSRIMPPRIIFLVGMSLPPTYYLRSCGSKHFFTLDGVYGKTAIIEFPIKKVWVGRLTNRIISNVKYNMVCFVERKHYHPSLPMDCAIVRLWDMEPILSGFTTILIGFYNAIKCTSLDTNQLKINFDSSSRGNPSPMRGGGVIRDSRGASSLPMQKIQEYKLRTWLKWELFILV